MRRACVSCSFAVGWDGGESSRFGIESSRFGIESSRFGGESSRSGADLRPWWYPAIAPNPARTLATA